MIGNANANVFPEPVCATPMQSAPARISGTQLICKHNSGQNFFARISMVSSGVAQEGVEVAITALVPLDTQSVGAH